jgi:hypothetical protein
MAHGGLVEGRSVTIGRALMGLAAAVLLLVMAVSPLAAQPANPNRPQPFTVRDVSVDRAAATAAAARELALLEGQRAAFRRLFERLVPRSESRRLPNLADSRIGDMVENYEVQNERTSAVRYIATLTYRFRPDAVRTVLRNAGIPFAEIYAKPYLVLPVLRQSGLTLLWDDPNPWRAAWGRKPPSDGLAPYVLPRGELADISTINAEQARRGDESRLTAIANRYSAAGVLVADAELLTGDSGRSVLQVTLTRSGGVIGDPMVVESYAAEPNEDTDTLMQRAAAEITRGVDERWKNDQLLRFGREATLTVAVDYNDITEWVAIRQRLADLTMIKRSDIVSLTRREAVVDLVYVGDENQLRVVLAQRDLELAPVTVADSGPSWRLTLSTPGAARALGRTPGRP